MSKSDVEKRKIYKKFNLLVKKKTIGWRRDTLAAHNLLLFFLFKQFLLRLEEKSAEEVAEWWSNIL